MPGPLAGVTILDFTRLLPGPYATAILADLGGAVTKIEDPGVGDYFRAFPPDLGPYGAAFAYCNRGKRAITLDLKNPRGRDVARRLAAGAAILVEGFRPGVMAAFGLGFEQLTALYPKLVYCSITGYGQTGPHASRAGHDLDYVALAGLLAAATDRAGDPIVPGIPIADLAGGTLWAVVGILAALREAERTGTGQQVDVSMTAGVQALLGVHGATALATGQPLQRSDSLFCGLHPAFTLYRCADGRWLAVAALESKFWSRFTGAIGVDGLADALLLAPAEWPSVRERIETVLASRSREEWLTLLSPLDCCVEPVLEIGEAFDHPQARAMGMTWVVPLPGGGSVPQPAFPVRLTATPAAPGGAAPLPSQHGRAILAEAGFNADEIAELESCGAVAPAAG